MSEPAVRDTDFDLKRLVDGVPSMLAYWDRDMRCRFANRAYERWFGVDPDALIGTSIRDLLGPDLFALNEPHIRGALAGEAQQFERVVPGPGGVQRHSLVNYTPDIVDGEVAGFTAMVTETTPLKQTETRLRISESALRTLAESSPFAIFRADADGQCRYSNARWREITGTGLDQNLGHRWFQSVHPDDAAAVDTAWNAAVQGGHELDLEFRVVRPDGETRFVRCRVRPEPPIDHANGGFVGAIEDVTDRKLAKERLRVSESFLQHAELIGQVGSWEYDLATRVVNWSERTRRIHEVEDDFVPSVPLNLQFYAPETRPVLEAALRRALDLGTPWDLKVPLVTATGRRIWVRTIGEVEREGGRPVRLVGALRDVTEQLQRRLELEREHGLRVRTELHAEKLDRLLNERSQMLEVMAHEVRQPLNNASAALQSAAAALVEAGEKVASLRLERAQAVMGQVLASIDNTLAVATLLARPEPIHREDTEIDMFLAMAIADIPSSDRIRIGIERHTETRTVSMDMNLMRLALRNLLSNALKYSPSGSPVHIRLSDSDEPLALVIDVTNAGPGIDADQVPRLFERGHRGVAVRRQSGLGLGLYIVRRVMELHGGRAELFQNSPGGVTMRLLIEQPLGD